MAPRARGISEPLNPALLATMRAQLAEGERLAWAAAPEPAGFELEVQGSEKLDAVVILGGGYATLGAAVMALRTGQWLWMSIPLALLVVGVLAFLVARWIKGRARKAVEGTVYGLSTRRAMIVNTFPRFSLQSFEIGTISDITLAADAGEFADVVLQPAGVVFRAIAEPERARNQLLRVIRDPAGVEQEISVAEAYAMEMQKLIARTRR
jgi:hypothetical protein